MDFANRAKASIDGLEKWLIERKKSGGIVVGYGAAHKGNTFLNAVGESSKTLKYVVDASGEKQGKFLPGSQIPVLEPEKLSSADPTDVLILPWNIAEELADRIRSLVRPAFGCPTSLRTLRNEVMLEIEPTFIKDLYYYTGTSIKMNEEFSIDSSQPTNCRRGHTR